MSDVKTLLIQINGKSWLQPDGSLGPEESAARFRFRVNPTGLDLMRIERLEERLYAEIDGSSDEIGAYLDRQKAAQQYAEYANALIAESAGIHKMERKDGESEEDFAQRQQAALLDAWDVCTDADAIKASQRWNKLNQHMEEVRMWARWQIMAESVPVGWARVHERSDYGKWRYALMQAWRQLHSEAEQGKD